MSNNVTPQEIRTKLINDPAAVSDTEWATVSSKDISAIIHCTGDFRRAASIRRPTIAEFAQGIGIPAREATHKNTQMILRRINAVHESTKRYRTELQNAKP